jgi:hypothetical protein
MLVRGFSQHFKAANNCLVRFGDTQQLQGGMSFEQCIPVLRGPLSAYKHKYYVPNPRTPSAAHKAFGSTTGGMIEVVS